MCRVEFPPSFSPDNKGKKGFFSPTIINAREPVYFNMVISDPQGNIVYETYDPENSWNGTYRGKPCPIGEYHYRASILENEKDPSLQEQHSGSFQLLR